MNFDHNANFLNLNQILCYSDNKSKNFVFKSLYKYLYGKCDRNHLIRLINYNNGYSGFCTNKWLEETVAIKCYDCEYDSTCAICLECFFNSDHKGHEFRLTRTSGGSCDCGDAGSWDSKGSCSNHSICTNYDEKNYISCFTNSFLLRLENLFGQIINYICQSLKNTNIVDEANLHFLLLFLNDAIKSTPSFRYALNLFLTNDTLKLWMLKHQILSNDLQKSFNSLYLTLLTLMSFKRKFSSLFASLYNDIVQPLKEIQDEWHLSNLSVQLFTYSNIAVELVKDSFLDRCLDPIMNNNIFDTKFKTLQFSRFDRKRFSLYIRVISDLTYLINHKSVCEMILKDFNLQNTLFKLLYAHNNMNIIERQENEHVPYENTGYSISFTIEHSLHTALKPLGDYCKSLKEHEYDHLIGLYKNFNDFIEKNMLNYYQGNKLARSFHIPLIRFFSYIIDFDFIRSCAKSFLKMKTFIDAKLYDYLHVQFPSFENSDKRRHDFLSVFNEDVLKFILKSSINVLKFALEIKHNLWVYNGESMFDQRSNYYELLFDTFDITSIQIATVLLTMGSDDTEFEVLSYIFDIAFDIEHYNKPSNDNSQSQSGYIGNDNQIKTEFIEPYNDPNELNDTFIDSPNSDIDRVEKLFENIENTLNNFNKENVPISDENSKFDDNIKTQIDEDSKPDPGTFEFKLLFFHMLINTLVNDIKHLEILSLPKKTKRDDYVRRGNHLLKMDIVNCLTSGHSDFGTVVRETKKHWKHHPNVIESIEEVASFNYSKVSDKTYIRLKEESYKMIDILWNTHNPITHSISKDSLTHDISLMGDFEMTINKFQKSMSEEYNDNQNIILNSISCNLLFSYIVLFISNFSNSDFKVESVAFRSVPDLHNSVSKLKIFEKTVNFYSNFKFSFSNSNECILYCIKILNLLLDKLPLPTVDAGIVLIKSLESLIKMTDDEIYRKCTEFVIKKLMKGYSLDILSKKTISGNSTKDVKSIQMKFIQRMNNQQKLFSEKLQFLSEEDESSNNIQNIVCILCKLPMDNTISMSYMSFISTNNVLRRCCSSYLEGSDFSYDVNVMSCLPMKSPIITSCGHIAHTKCIDNHRKIQSDTHLFSLYGIQRINDEFFCPMCKSLCNFSLKIIPDSSMTFEKDFISDYSNYNYERNASFMINITSANQGIQSLDNSPKLTHVKIEKKLFKPLSKLCKTSWRHPYSTNWLILPSYSRHESNPELVYALNNFTTSKNINLYLNPENRNQIDDLKVSRKRPLKYLECKFCSNCDLNVFKNGQFNCPSFKPHKNVLLPLHRFTDLNKSNKVERVMEYFIKRWPMYKNTDVYKYINVNDSYLDYTEMFPRVLKTTYSKTLFSQNRTYFGFQNWRHVNSTCLIDPKFWLLYNELLNVSSFRRNTLNVPNSLYSQLIRNFYLSGISHTNHQANFSSDNILDYNIELDQTYYDDVDGSIALPNISHFNDRALSDKTNLIRIFLETLGDTKLYELYKAFKIVDPGCQHDIKDYDIENGNEEFFVRIFNTEYDISSISSIKPLKKYLREERPNVYKMFGNDLIINPWSCDFIREFLLYFLSNKNSTLKEVRNQLYYYLIVATLQVMDRYIVEIVKNDYKKFINECSSIDPGIMQTRIRRDFMTSFSNRFFKELFENGDIPSDYNSRMILTDFYKHLSSFRSYNMFPEGTTILSKFRKPTFEYKFSKAEFKTFNDILTDVITYVSMMKSVHDYHVLSFTEPIPDLKGRFEPTADELDKYLLNQVSRVLKVREILNNVNNTFEVDNIIACINETFDNENSSKRRKIVESDNDEDNDLKNILINPPKNDLDTIHSQNNYKGVDLTKRINKLLYKNHCNTAFFEVLKSNIPSSIHILDMIDLDFFSGFRMVPFDNSTKFMAKVESIFNYLISYFKRNGYIRKNTNVDFKHFKKSLFNSVNLYLDVSFWTMNSVFPSDQELCTKISYAHLYQEDERFGMLFDALELDFVSNADITLEALNILFSLTYKNQLKMNRLCNMEVIPPIINKYKLIDISKHLDELNWNVVKFTSFRICPNCGQKPSNPLICLLCGSLICSNNECCHKMKTSDESTFLTELEKSGIEFIKTDLLNIYDEEMIAHSHLCGGGQSIYFSPYYCVVLCVDDKRRCVIQSIYSDKYGNSDLHGKVYGNVKLSKVRVENIVNTLCSGRLSNEIVNHRKQLVSLFN